MEIKYVKSANIDLLEQEISNAGLELDIKSIESFENLLIINTDKNLSKNEQNKLYEIILKHLAPSQEELDLEAKACDYRIFGNNLADLLVDKFGARNFKNKVPSVVINQLIVQFAPLENALRKGALNTARSGIMQIKNKFPVYVDILEWGVNKIDTKLGTN